MKLNTILIRKMTKIQKIIEKFESDIEDALVNNSYSVDLILDLVEEYSSLFVNIV